MSLSLPPTALTCLWPLLQAPGYRAPAASLPLPSSWSQARRLRLWRQLQQQGVVDLEIIVTRFGLSATGRTLLQLDTSVWPVTPDEKYILQSCRDRSIHPDRICARVPHDQRPTLIASLAQQGLLRITQQTVGDVWLTPSGVARLRSDATCSDAAPG